ncbi:hypothetical protein OE749_16860 [Aestuariibacter sp. AA17]|uniref:PEP-CTERM sorting domain-containing protein n=1 Tax=Fluctibacter corallii TaxID=2984329 RepID=A0ABT3ACI7_9ALTE|nr:hypothetical protein [Aestuariibacter sp. AA17]MCV2886368.1 hypothetical protein [Aestuariibacter sp. AA17]
MRMHPISRLFIMITLIFQGVTANAALVNLDLNDFFADPAVSVSPDGSSATINEDPSFSFVLLSNDPGLGDPNILNAQPDVGVAFDFNFVEAANGNDQFRAFLTDDAGNGLGGAFNLTLNNSLSGSALFNLSGFVGQTLGLTFQLSSLPGDIDFSSFVEISNLRLQTVVTSVSEPHVALLLIPFFAAIGMSRNRKSH